MNYGPEWEVTLRRVAAVGTAGPEFVERVNAFDDDQAAEVAQARYVDLDEFFAGVEYELRGVRLAPRR